MNQNLRTQMNQFGFPAERAAGETQPIFMHDTLFWKATAPDASPAVHTNTIDQHDLFDDTVKHTLLKTNKFPLPYTRIVRLTHVAVTHNLDFTRDDHLFAFEENSYLDINIEGKDQFRLPLEYMLNYARVPQGKRDVHTGLPDLVNSGTTDPGTPDDYTMFYNTTENQLKYYDGTAWHIVNDMEVMKEKFVPVPKYTGYVALPTYLDLPRGGQQRITFNPGGVNLTTSSITASGYKFGAGVIDSTDSPVMFIKFKFAGRLVRPVK